MNNVDLENDLKSFIIEQMELPKDVQINYNSKLIHCGLDSLDVVDLIFLIEDRYDITIMNPQKLITFGDLINVIQTEKNI